MEAENDRAEKFAVSAPYFWQRELRVGFAMSAWTIAHEFVRALKMFQAGSTYCAILPAHNRWEVFCGRDTYCSGTRSFLFPPSDTGLEQI